MMMIQRLPFNIQAAFALVAFVALLSPHPVMGQTPLTIEDLVIVAIDQVSVPAVETGLLANLDTREGDAIVKGDLLARLDDKQARMAESLAKNQLAIATAQAKNFHALELAGKNLLRQQQLAEQQQLMHDIADRKANSNVRILAAEKSEAVAKNELSRASRARESFVDSVSRSEIESLQLAHERSQLETKQAELDQEIDRLTAESEDRAAAVGQLDVQRAQLEVSLADGDKKIAQLQVTSRRHEAELASLVATRHRIYSPISGTVAEIFKRPGEWIQVGEPLIRIVRLDRLRAEGFVSADKIDEIRGAKNVDLTIHQAGGEDINREGEVVFVSPEIDSVNDEVRFWVEFDNRKQDVLPGMRLSVSLRGADE